MKLRKILSAVLSAVIMFSCVSGLALPAKAAGANIAETYRFIKDVLGVSDAVACGILANLERESNFNPNSQYIEADGSLSYGICQWNKGRLENLKAFCSSNGYDYTSLTGQLYFLKYELEGSERSAYAKVLNVSNDAEGAYEAGYNWAKYFERCSSKFHEERAVLAQNKYWPIYGTGSDSEYTKIASGKYLLKNTASGKYLSVDGGADVKNANISVSDYTGDPSQVFEITPGVHGYKMRPLCSDERVTNIYATIVASGKNVCLWDETGDGSQLWYFNASGEVYTIHSVQKEDCVLDTSGTNVCVMTNSGSSSQKWVLQSEAEAERENTPCSHENTRTSGAVGATCFAAGYTGDVWCADCGTFLSKGSEIPALPHTYESSGVIATPDCQGYTKYVCSVCGHTYNDEYTDYSPLTYPTLKLSDEYGSANERVSVTLNAENFPEIKDIEISDITYDKTALTLDSAEWLIASDASEITEGSANALFNSPSAINGKILKLSFTVSKEAKDGNYPISCQGVLHYPVIGESDAEIYANIISGAITVGPCLHKNGFEYRASLAPTCTEKGYAEHYACPVCGIISEDPDGACIIKISDIEISPSGHEYESFYTVDAAPTEAEAGSRSIHCKKCDSKISSTVMIPYSEAPKGDYNGDGDVNMNDAVSARKYMLGVSPDEWLYFDTADTDSDGHATMKDIVNIRKYLLGIIDF